MKASVFILILFAATVAGCKKEPHQKPAVQVNSNPVADTLHQNTVTVEEPVTPEEKITILIVPISNGYGYSAQGYNFNPVLDSLLRIDSRVEVLKFPYKKFNGSGFQGVNDKRYAGDILKNTEADILIMSWYADNGMELLVGQKRNWGYHIKLLNTKTLEQKVSIGAEYLKDHNAVEQHIQKNVDVLVTDILTLKN